MQSLLFRRSGAPLFDVVEAFGRLQVFQQAIVDWNRLERVAQQLGHAVDVVLAFDVVADRGISA